jgi:RNA polymerase sigma-70 factor (ECF subfamily)
LNLTDRFPIWIDRHHQALYRHALWMTAQPDLALELVQETFYQAWESRHSLRDERRVLPWLLTILRRAAIREYRARCRSERQAEALRTELPDEGCEQDLQDMLDLAQALEGLSAAQRDILLRYALHGFSYEEIGEQLSIPIGTVMSRISRARQALRRQMDQAPPAADNIAYLDTARKGGP